MTNILIAQEIEIKIDTTNSKHSLRLNSTIYNEHVSLKILRKELGENYKVEITPKKFFRDPRHHHKFGHKSFVIVYYESLGIGFKGPSLRKLNELMIRYDDKEKKTIDTTKIIPQNEIEKVLINFSDLFSKELSWLPMNCTANNSPLTVNINGVKLNSEITFTNIQNSPYSILNNTLDSNGNNVENTPIKYFHLFFNMRFYFSCPANFGMINGYCDAVYPRILTITIEEKTKSIVKVVYRLNTIKVKKKRKKKIIRRLLYQLTN